MFQTIRESQGSLKFLIVLHQGGNFLHTEALTQLRMIATKYYHFVYHSLLCSCYEGKFCFVMKLKILTAKNKVKVPQNPTSVQ